jgi:hypothetical protein
MNGEVDVVDEVVEGLDGEIEAVRAAVRRARGLMEEELEVGEFWKVSQVVFRGAGMVATLLKAKRILAGKEGDDFMDVLGPVIDELFAENGWEV